MSFHQPGPETPNRWLFAGVCLVASLLLLLLLALFPRPASADHGVVACGGTGQKACLSLTSPFVEQYIKARGEVTWCVDSRGLQYPGFRDQVREVTAKYADQLGVPHREVTFPDSQMSLSCIVRHEMPDIHRCGGCGAWIFTQNMPVKIEYNRHAGFTYFYSTIGHEMGHGYCLLDEHYDKEGFTSFILKYGRWIHGEPTVMDSGTHAVAGFGPYGIWYLTEYDLDRCEETLGRSLTNEFRDCTTYPGWEGTVSCWWPKYNAWLWLITDAQGRGQLWEWSPDRPGWRCTRGCPGS